ncbi:MAG: endonuclease/exonuclease/phosphatase family protein [Candidatus Heimdallarchaeaceae archaeon]
MSPVILLFIPSKFDFTALILTSAIAYICRFLFEFHLSPMVNIFLSALGVGSLLMWIALELMQKNKEHRTFLSYTFLSALILDLALRIVGNSIDISISLEITSITTILGLFSLALCIWGIKKVPLEELKVKTEGDTLEEGRPLYTSFQTSFILVSALFLISIVLGVPNVLTRWSSTKYSSVPHFWILASLELIILSAFLLLYDKVISKFESQKKYVRLGIFLVAELLLIPLLVTDNIVTSYIAMVALPLLLLFVTEMLQKTIFKENIRKKLFLAFTISLFVLLLLFLTNIFAFNYAYVPAGLLFRSLNNWALLFPLIITSFFIVNQKYSVIKSIPRTKVSKIYRIIVVFAAIAILIPSAIIYGRTQIPQTQTPTELKVVTYNIQQGFSEDGNFNFHAVYSTLADINADIIGLQETETNRITSLNMDIVQWLAWKLNMYYYQGPALSDLCYGIALLSRYPIKSAEVVLMPSEGEQTAYITSIIEVGSYELNIIVTHFGEYLEDRINQAYSIYQYIQSSSYSRSILLGDFNSEYGSDPYNIITQIYHDAWLRIYPTGLNATGYEGNTSGEHRIDLIFYFGLNALSCRVITESLAADHKPVSASFMF